MSSSTPYLDVLSKHFPAECSSEQARSAVDTLLAFASGWVGTRSTCCHEGGPRPCSPKNYGCTRGRPTHLYTPFDIHDLACSKKRLTSRFTEKTIRFVNPSSRAVESSIPLSCISRIFLVPTRGKAKQHWTVVMLSSDVPEKGKATTSNPHQIIFGLDAISASKFDTTSYSGSSTPSTSTVAKGEETLSVLCEFLTHLPISFLEASATVFRSACATPKSGHSAAGIDAYLAAKPGTLWFFDSGVLWGESKPCEFWAVGDLIPKDGVRLISATGRTCSVILGRKTSSMQMETLVETEFSMVDGREQDPINGWARQRKHLATTEEQPSIDSNTAANDINNSSSSDSEASDVGSGSHLDDGSEEEDNRGSDVNGEESGEESEEELQEAHHPLLRPGAMPRMSKATIDAVVDMVNEDLMGGSEEEDELDDS
ncbi:hypothetical protein EDB19DRAFT_2010175 [Suillus lakei]|nr:hypothetical protein EDB19DRAFT_2010175 [Suillus lakei]